MGVLTWDYKPCLKGHTSETCHVVPKKTNEGEVSASPRRVKRPFVEDDT